VCFQAKSTLTGRVVLRNVVPITKMFRGDRAY
jgi:hypothetical protein